jgi:hypothetical protein
MMMMPFIVLAETKHGRKECHIQSLPDGHPTLKFTSRNNLFLESFDTGGEMMLFIGTRFSNLYTAVHTPA